MSSLPGKHPPASADLPSRMRHSAAHVMAEAVLRLRLGPTAKVAIGPAIDDGFEKAPMPLVPETTHRNVREHFVPQPAPGPQQAGSERRLAPGLEEKHRGTMTRRLAAVLAVLVTLVLTSDAARGAPARPAPATVAKQIETELLASYRPYACCTESLATCLKKASVCPLAKRLERAIHRMAASGLAKPAIEAALAHRQATMKPEQPRATIVLDDRFRAGSANTGVALAVYACPRQEACAKLIPDLYREVTDGRLKSKAVLYYRPFFPPGNPEAIECGRGLYAAAYQGKFWPYLLHLCMERETLQRPTMRDWAVQNGLDRCIFDHTCEQPDTTAWLEVSHKEGQANGVDAAPAVFLNGRRVHGSLDLETLVDLAEEEHERVAQAAGKESAASKAPAPKPARK